MSEYSSKEPGAALQPWHIVNTVWLGRQAQGHLSDLVLHFDKVDSLITKGLKRRAAEADVSGLLVLCLRQALEAKVWVTLSRHHVFSSLATKRKESHNVQIFLRSIHNVKGLLLSYQWMNTLNKTSVVSRSCSKVWLFRCNRTESCQFPVY